MTRPEPDTTANECQFFPAIPFSGAWHLGYCAKLFTCQWALALAEPATCVSALVPSVSGKHRVSGTYFGTVHLLRQTKRMTFRDRVEI
jgi:hypothetical protein